MRWACLSLLLFAGCAHVGADGKPISSMKWCARGPVKVERTSVGGAGHEVDSLGLAPAVRPCMPVLAADGAGDLEQMLFEITTNEFGSLTDVCLLGTTHPADSGFFECLDRELRRTRQRLPPSAKGEIWRLSTVFD